MLIKNEEIVAAIMRGKIFLDLIDNQDKVIDIIFGQTSVIRDKQRGNIFSAFFNFELRKIIQSFKQRSKSPEVVQPNDNDDENKFNEIKLEEAGWRQFTAFSLNDSDFTQR